MTFNKTICFKTLSTFVVGHTIFVVYLYVCLEWYGWNMFLYKMKLKFHVICFHLLDATSASTIMRMQPMFTPLQQACPIFLLTSHVSMFVCIGNKLLCYHDAGTTTTTILLMKNMGSEIWCSELSFKICAQNLQFN